MEGSCSTLESSVLLDDTPGRGISKTPLRRQSGDVVVKAPVGVVERDCEGGVEDKAKQQFVIPRRKDASSSELLQRVDSCTRDGKDIQSIVLESMRKSESQTTFAFQEMHIVKNQSLLKQYHAKRHEMKEEGRTMTELGERYGFILTESFSKVKSLCENGLSTESQTKQIVLGDPSYGVYLCKHADITSPVPLQVGRDYYLVVFKYTKGRVKGVNAQSHGHVVMEPTPNFDCHALKCPLTDGSLAHNQLYDSCQLYLYEFGELDMANQPRHCVPYAVIKFNIAEKGSNQSLPCPQESEIEGLQRSDVQSNYTGVLAWQGPLYNKNKYIGCVGIYCFSHDKLALNFNEALNMKAKVTFEKLRSALPQPVFLAGPPYRARQGAVVRGSNCYHYCQIRAQSNCDGNFEKLVRFLLENNWAGMAEVSETTKLYMLPTSDFTVNLGMTSSSDELRLHGLLCWKTASSLPACHVLSTDGEENNSSLADRPKSVAPFSSGKDAKQPLGTSGQDAFMDNLKNVAIYGVPPLDETVIDDQSPSRTTCIDEPTQESALCSEDPGQTDEWSNSAPVGIIYSPDQSDRSSPAKRVEVVKSNCDENEVTVTADEERDKKVGVVEQRRLTISAEHERLTSPITSKELRSSDDGGVEIVERTNKLPSDSRELVSELPKLPQQTRSVSPTKDDITTYHDRKFGKLTSVRGKSRPDNSDGDPGTAGTEEVVYASARRAEKPGFLHSPKRGRPRGRPFKRRRSKRLDCNESKRVALENSAVYTEDSGIISAVNEETDLAPACSMSIEKTTVTSSNFSALHPDKSGLDRWFSHESSPANNGQCVSNTDGEMSCRDSCSAHCEEQKQSTDGRLISVTTVKIGPSQHLADGPTLNGTSKASTPDPLIGSVNETRTQGKSRDPRLHRRPHNGTKLIEEVLQDTADSTSKDCSEQCLVLSRCSETLKAYERREDDSQGVNLDTDSQHLQEICQSEAASNQRVRSVNGNNDVPVLSRPDGDKDIMQRSIENWSGKGKFVTEQKELAETRMQLWLERKGNAEFSSSRGHPSSMHRDVQSPESNVPGYPKVTDSFRRRSDLLQSFETPDGEEINVEKNGRQQSCEESDLPSSHKVPATANPTPPLQEPASDCTRTTVEVNMNKVYSDNLCFEKEEVSGSGRKNAKRDDWRNKKQKEYRKWSSNGCSCSPVSSGSKDDEICNTEMSYLIAPKENSKSDGAECRQKRNKSPVLSDISVDSPRQSVLGKQEDVSTRDTRDVGTQTERIRSGQREVATQTEVGVDFDESSVMLRPRSLQFSSNIPLLSTRKEVADVRTTASSKLTSVVEKFERTVLSRSYSKTPQLEEQIEEYLSSARKEAGMTDLHVHDTDGTVEDISPAVSPTEMSAFTGTGLVSFSGATDPFESFHQNSRLTGRSLSSERSELARRKRRKRWDVTVSDVETDRNYTNAAVLLTRDLEFSQQHGRVETMKQEIMGSIWEKLLAEKRQQDQSLGGLSSLAYRRSGTFLSTYSVSSCTVPYSPSRPTYEGDSTPPLEDYD